MVQFMERRPIEKFSPFIIAAVILLVFGNTLFHQFTYDDRATILESRFIESPRNLSSIFNQDYFRQTPERSFRPVVTITYMFDHLVWGKRPFGYHLSNLILHVLAALLFHSFLSRFFKMPESRLFATLLFALHPAVCEAVNSVSNREDLLAGVFVLATLLMIFPESRRLSAWRIAAAATFSLLAYLSKESAAPLVLIIFLIPYIRLQNDSATSGKTPPAFPASQLAAFAIFLALRFFIMVPETKIVTKVLGGSAPSAMAHGGYLFLKAWRALLAPHPLNADYVFWHIRGALTIQSLAGIAFMFIYCALIYYLWKKGARIFLFSLLWILLFFLPVSNIIPLTNPFAERYLYLPLMGLAILGGWLFESWKFRRWAWIVILALAWLSNQRNLVWSNDDTLWAATLKTEPRSVRALNGMGLFHLSRQNLTESRKLFGTALEYDPDDYEVRNNLAVALVLSDMPQEAEAELKKALILKPDYSKAHYNLARLYKGMGRTDEAKRHLDAAVKSGYPVPDDTR